MSVERLQAEMTSFVESLQDDICAKLERADGRARFREDLWQREGGGGGRTRVMEEGDVFEKGGVNVSTVYGELSESFAKRLPGEGRTFFAAGLSLVLHPKNPFVPTVHANYRVISHGPKAWFGGGADLTPYYLFEEDAAHFHRVYQAACARHPKVADYPRFKRRCDEYFFIKHRGERRGVGGIFFEDEPGPLDAQFALVQELGQAFVPSYVPIVERRHGLPYGAKERAWQELRRGRYVEFNLVYDRGTLFGLETQGRVESILMSLPPQVQWRYDAHPPENSPEALLLEVLRAQPPRDWA